MQLVVLYPASPRGFLRLADYCNDARLEALALAQAYTRDYDSRPKIIRRLVKLRDCVPWGPLSDPALDQLIPDGTRSSLLDTWSPELCPLVLWTSTTVSRDRLSYRGQYELPRFFSWLYPGRLAGMSTPRHEADIDTLAEMGFTHILTLTAESPLDETWFTHRVTHIYLPIENYGAPTLQEMDMLYTRFTCGGTWLVHCGGGVGRAGTVLACLLAMFGDEVREDVPTTPALDAKTAVTMLRQIRPRSLESALQERFVTSWISHRWKVSHEGAEIDEPYSTLLVEGSKPTSEAPLVFLIGLPGSGKSWLANAIMKRRSAGKTQIISQDDSGSRSACERQISQKISPDTLLILDRCNPLSDDRAGWLALTDRPRIAVYFDYSKDLCRQRIDSRLDHPTIRAGRGDNALSQFDREMQRPRLDEGFGQILTVTSFAAARQAVIRLAGYPPLLKFPRTPHLLDLGATTSDDIIRPAFERLTGHLSVEEKVDGANIGFSLDWDGAIRCQNRSHWVSSADHAQFKSLDKWIADHSDQLRRLLGQDAQYPERYILYGEWLVARHSISYTALPDPFLAFDMLDRVTNVFLSRKSLSRALNGTGIRQVPLLIECCEISRLSILQFLEEASAFSDSKLEGVYVRWEDDKRLITLDRGKIVRSDFICGNQHWSKNQMELNAFTINSE
jgi:atypical dual specificity phosphatase